MKMKMREFGYFENENGRREFGFSKVTDNSFYRESKLSEIFTILTFVS